MICTCTFLTASKKCCLLQFFTLIRHLNIIDPDQSAPYLIWVRTVCYWSLRMQSVAAVKAKPNRSNVSMCVGGWGTSIFSENNTFLCPRHENGRGIKCYPCPSVRTYVLTYICRYVLMYVRLSRRRPLSNSNIFYQNFMKLGHIV